tara:strand:- start:563 stop:790 length:228 start_codon:yes stop_codon:yes gene_type:complete
MKKKETINVTLKIDSSELFKFQELILSKYELINLKVLPSTNLMYEEDTHFQKLVKAVKSAQKIRDEYINENNFKY